MSVELKYYDEFGNPFFLTRDDDGFWQSRPDPDPTHFETDFTNDGALDTGLTVVMNGVPTDWFQIDNVKLYGNDDVDDFYNMSIRDYNDASASGNPQLYREVSEFPNPLEEILVPVNDFITHSSFNTILSKMGENYQFLIDKAKFLSVPPNSVSFRFGPSEYPEYEEGNVWMQLDNGYAQYWGYDPLLNAENIAGTSTTMVYTIQDTMYATNLVSGADPSISASEDSRDYYIYGDDKFTNIKSVEVDSNEFIWVLDDAGDHGKVGIFSYEENWKFQSSWNVTTEGSPKYMINPTDLKLREGKVYISCDSESTGQEIRVFTEVGSYEGSVSHEDLINIESVAVTTDYITALSENKLYRFGMDLQFIEVIDLFEQIFTYNYATQLYDEATITKLCNNRNGVFFYGIAGNQIYKFGQSGVILESFGETMVNYINSSISIPDELYYDKDISDLYHDINYNLFASSKYDVVKYYDRAEVYDRLLDDLSFNIYDEVWDESQLDVGQDENTTSWIYNRVFDRILDNLNMYRLALKGSQVLISSNTFETVSIDNFNPKQYVPLDYNKGDIAIGVNELHCEGALNRCLRQLHECFETCLGFINLKDTGIDPDSLRITEFELIGQTESRPLVDFIDGVYYYDYGRPVTDFHFKWLDTISYRGDPKLRAYIIDSVGIQHDMVRFDTPTEWIDDTVSYSGGDYTWQLIETYGELVQTKDVNVKWSKRLYAGVLEDSAIPEDDDIENTINQRWTSLSPEMDGTITIDRLYDLRYYIAVPKDEWDSGDLKIYHPDYPEMEYEWLPPNIITLNNFDGGHGNAGDYYVFTCQKINGEPVYGTGIEEINFRIVRT